MNHSKVLHHFDMLLSDTKGKLSTNALGALHDALSVSGYDGPELFNSLVADGSITLKESMLCKDMVNKTLNYIKSERRSQEHLELLHEELQDAVLTAQEDDQ